MRKDQIKTPQDALAYSLDCQLATVEDLMIKKIKNKRDFNRQVSIAQNLLDFCIQFGANTLNTRADDVIKLGNSVEQYVINKLLYKN